MTIRDLVPRWGRDREPARRERDEQGVLAFHRDVNRLFDAFFGDFGMLPSRITDDFAGGFAPRVNVSETDQEVTVSAELPGLDEKDVSVELAEETLTLKGEKTEDREERDRNWHRVEHRYGSFHRVIALPARVEAGKAKARFKKGVLTVTLPKHPEEQSKRKSIEIQVE